MERLGIVTGADLAAKDIAFLERHFGSSGPTYYRLARGICDRQVRPDRERKSIGAEDTFMEDLTDPARMEEELARISQTIWSRMEGRGIEGRTVVLKMKYQDFRIVTRTHSLPRPVAGREEFLDIGRNLLHRLVPVAKPVRLLGLTLAGLGGNEPAPELEPSLPL
jgi:DNA polymerase-4